MKIAKYIEPGEVEIVDGPVPVCPKGGLLIKTEASGLCPGELMDWYMEKKISHVLGHEVCGKVIESNYPRFPVGSRVVPHHHAPCMNCEFCKTGRYVHCRDWKLTKFEPGGMCAFFALYPQNLSDCHLANDLQPEDAALAEPTACVIKSITLANQTFGSTAVIGLGAMGLIMLLANKFPSIGYDLNLRRIDYARSLGINCEEVSGATPADVVYVCPGTQAALDLAISIVNPGGKIILFAPFHPSVQVQIPFNQLYFDDIQLIPSYSCGPPDMVEALSLLRSGTIQAKQIVSDLIGIEELPKAYRQMRAGEILKPMVIFQ